jgi:carbon monoxide dehydrogenase subunit G
VKLEQTFEVDAPLERVWEALIDVERVAPCLPGATIAEAGEDGTYQGTFSAKVGPASVSFKGTLKMEQVDEATHTATMLANGSNRRGQGGAKATIVSTVSPGDGGGTKVDIDTDYTITGPLARLGRGGMIEDVGNRLLREFASCLEQRLAHEQAVEVSVEETAPPAEAAEAAQEATAYRQTPDLEAPQAPQAQTPPPAPPPQAKPIGGFALLLGVLRDRLKRLFKR